MCLGRTFMRLGGTFMSSGALSCPRGHFHVPRGYFHMPPRHFHMPPRPIHMPPRLIHVPPNPIHVPARLVHTPQPMHLNASEVSSCARERRSDAAQANRSGASGWTSPGFRKATTPWSSPRTTNGRSEVNNVQPNTAMIPVHVPDPGPALEPTVISVSTSTGFPSTTVGW